MSKITWIRMTSFLTAGAKHLNLCSGAKGCGLQKVGGETLNFTWR